MPNNQEINDILDRINKGIDSPADRASLNSWYADFDDSKTIVKGVVDENLKDTIWSKIEHNLHVKPVLSIRKLIKYAAVAASVALVSSLAWYRYADENEYSSTLANVQLDAEASSEKELSMSEQDFLDSSKYLKIESSKSTYSKTVIKTKPQQFVKMELSDGTKISLNAGSTLRIDDHFDNGRERKVYLSGEAYFEVTKDASRPFVVMTKGQNIQVLGTKFNVRGYDDQSKVTTTLFEGKIKIAQGKNELVMNPNETVTNDGNTIKIVSETNTKIAADWRSLKYSFNDESIKDVVTQLAIKYGLDVRYHGDIPNLTISGKLDKEMSLEEIMTVMSHLTGGNFSLSGNKLSINFL